MPRPRVNQQQQQQHLQQTFSASALHQLQQQQAIAQQLLMSQQQTQQQYLQQQQQQQQQQNYNQARIESLVQRSQGVIFLTSNKPQMTTAVSAPQTSSAQQNQHHLLQQQHHAPVPAHQQNSTSLFPSLSMPTFVPAPIMQNSFTPYYHPVPPVAPVAVAPQVQQQQQSNDVYVPNGAVNYEGDYMQAPPAPIKGRKPKRRTRRRAMDTSSEDSTEDELIDDDDDPEWNPQANPEIPEPIMEQAPSRRGRRVSTTNSTPRGRGRGGGRGRGRGRGRGGRNYHSEPAQEPPPALINQLQANQVTRSGRQTRNSNTGLHYNMPSLEPQGNDLTIGELVSAAVRSLNDGGEDDSYSHGKHRKKRVQIYGAKLHKQANYWAVEKVPVDYGPSLFIYIDTSQPQNLAEEKDESGLVAEDEDLIMSYEIIQEEDKDRSFLCENCGHPSKSRILHNRHLVTHDQEFRFACCVCSQLFSSHDMLKPHLRTHHGKGLFVCPDLECEGIFQERKSLDDHEFACHPNARPFVCRFCFDRFPTTEESTAHEENHSEEITADCMKCGEAYTNKSLLKQHYIDMHEEKQCQYCEEKFENKPALEEHQEEKHAELIKPPTPEPPPGPPSPDPIPQDEMDDPTYSPDHDDGGDDDGDIQFVEEHVRPRSTRAAARKSSLKKPPKKTPEPSSAKKTVKFKDWKASQENQEPTPSTSKAALSSPTPSTSKAALSSKPKPGPASSKSKSPSQPVRKVPPAKNPIKLTDPEEVIILSSDDEKDPGWKPAVGKSSNRQKLSSAPKRSRPSSSSSTKSPTEYVIVVDGNEENGGKRQELKFVFGDNGELKQVPSSTGLVPSESLPMKEIMDIIKSKNISENTTIVIEDDKVQSVQSSNAYNSNKAKNKGRITPLSKTTNKRAVNDSEIEVEWEGPQSKSSAKTLSSSNILRKSAEVNSKRNGQPAKTQVVAKKRTGGIPRSSSNDTGLSNSLSNSSSIDTGSEKSKLAPAAAGPIAKKRTGGTKDFYDAKKSSLTVESNRSRKDKLVPRNNHIVTVSDDDDDTPVFIVETNSIIKPKTPVPSMSRNSRSEELRDPLADDMDDDTPVFIVETSDIVTPRFQSVPPPQPVNIKPKKRGRKPKADKVADEEVDWEDPTFTASLFSSSADDAPKRSLRIALKASVTETNMNEADDPLDVAPPPPPPVNRSSSTSKRGRPSNSNRNGLSSSQQPTSSKNSSATAQPSSSNSEGQIVMKALVNGEWKDVVIGTKLPSDSGGSASVNNAPLPYMTNLANSRSTGGSIKPTGNRNKKQTKSQPKAPAASRGGRRSGTGGSRRGKGKANNKKADPNADCWNDDRYQFFSSESQPYAIVPEDSVSYDDYSTEDPMQTYGDQHEDANDDSVLPFSLSSYMTNYHEEDHQQQEVDEEPSLDDQGGMPVIVNAFHVDSTKQQPYQHTFVGNEDNGDEQMEDEVPMVDPLAMDSEQNFETEPVEPEEPPKSATPPPSPKTVSNITPEQEEEEEESEEENGDPLSSSVKQPFVPPPPVLEPKKGTVQEAKSAIFNLRDVLAKTKINFGK